MWNSKLDEMVKIAASLSKKKKAKTSKELLKKYLSLGPSTRNHVLSAYQYDRKQVFKDLAVEYVAALVRFMNFNLRTAAIRSLLRAGKSPLAAMLPPRSIEFEFLPSELEMAKLIEKAVNSR
jgi:hypothetical protein